MQRNIITLLVVIGIVTFFTFLILGSLNNSENDQNSKVDNSNGDDMGKDESIENRKWILTEYVNSNGEKVVLNEILEGALKMDMLLKEGQVSGFSGCNNYTGSYTLGAKNELSFGPLATTLKLCTPEILNTIEYEYTQALAKTSSYKVENISLELYDENKNMLMKFTEGEPVSLENKMWNVLGVNNQSGGVTSLPSDVKITAEFSDGEVRGEAGCDLYRVEYTYDENKISFRNASVTENECDQVQKENRDLYLNGLLQSDSYEISGDRLQLRSGPSLMVDYNTNPGL